MFNTIRLWFRTFAPLEERILEAVVDALSSPTREVVRKQLDVVDRVRRVGNESVFYRIVDGRPSWDGVPLFDDRGTWTLASGKVVVAGTESRFRVECVSGHVFSLMTRPRIGRHLFAVPTSIVIESTFDVSTQTSQLPPDLVDWYDSGRDSRIWNVLAPNEAYTVNLPEGEFLVVADRQGDVLLKWDTGGGYFLADGGCVEPAVHDSFAAIVTDPNL